jgi:hypothetical protein
MYPTQAKKRLEWATVGFVAVLKWFFPQPLFSLPSTWISRLVSGPDFSRAADVQQK